ncbi:MAG: RAD55 family ATPase [Candidatus Geothermarchaeales archaeon]
MEGLDCVSTGIPGMDELLDKKGIPRGYTVFLIGDPGAGKTIFAIQFLYSGATQCDETGVYISLDENTEDIKRVMSGFNWDLGKLEEEGRLVMIDASPIRRLSGDLRLGGYNIGSADFSFSNLIDKIKRKIREVGAKRVVIDPLTIIKMQFPDETKRWYAVKDLMENLAELGCTVLLVSEVRGPVGNREYLFEEFLTQGVILLRVILFGGRFTNVVHVEKMRGLRHDRQLRPFQITSEGIKVYPEDVVLL